MVGQVRREPVEPIRDRRAGRTPRRVVGPEHEVVDEKLRAPFEEIRQRGAPLVGLESVRLVDPDPRQFLTSPRQLIAAPRQLLLLLEQPEAGRKPLFTCSGRMVGHYFSPWSGRLYSQLSSLISFGAGAPFPVSRRDFRLNRKTPHLVLQWCMNSTGSFQPWCLKRTMVQSLSCLSSKLTLVPIHSSGPSTTCHSTCLAG